MLASNGVDRDITADLADFLLARLRETRAESWGPQVHVDAEIRLAEFLRPDADAPEDETLYLAWCTLRILADVYSSHPDYRIEWRR